MNFYGRQKQLEKLDKLYSQEGAGLAVVYGRRRVGKTALLNQWTKKHINNKRVFYWFATIATEQVHLQKFSDELANFSGMHGRHFSDWVSALQALGDLADREETKLVVIIDEFTYLLDADASISSQFQKAWDLFLQHKNIMVVISGSYMGMMHEHVLSYSAPLYGRATYAIFLQPFSYGHTKAFFPNHPADLRVGLYSVWGGIAGYWRAIRTTKTLRAGIEDQLLTTDSPFHGEPQLLLQDNTTSHNRYFSIVEAISTGHREAGEIAQKIGYSSSTALGPYLKKLETARIIERQLPVTASKKSKSGRYQVIDPFLRFYYRFIEPNIKDIETEEPKQAYLEIEQHLAEFIGTHTWEEICQEWVLRAGVRSMLYALPGKVGRIWNSKAQVDVAAYNSNERHIMLGECKWTRNAVDGSIVNKLRQQAEHVIPGGRPWTVSFLFFSRSGFTQTGKSAADQLLGLEGSNWKVTESLCLDLDQIDRDLVTWAENPEHSTKEIDF
ncbi:MAG TPA: ATP-binding protein [Anaerolineales bacterium]|nr:ATP-binding protein [Anaerolineales bacterium]